MNSGSSASTDGTAADTRAMAVVLPAPGTPPTSTTRGAGVVASGRSRTRTLTSSRVTTDAVGAIGDSHESHLHLDLVSPDQPAEVDRAVALGATRIGDFDEYGTRWTTLADPEGNVFDIGHPSHAYRPRPPRNHPRSQARAPAGPSTLGRRARITDCARPGLRVGPRTLRTAPLNRPFGPRPRVRRRASVKAMSDRLPEPTDVGPIAGGNLRASDADRDHVATLLTTAYAEGRLSKDEHDERLDALMQAKTFDDLIPITSDLVVVAPSAPAPTSSVAIDTSQTTDEPDRHIAIFGGVTRKGDWRVRRKTQSFALFGGMDLDMREAIFEAPVVEIAGFWCFGGLDIKVPEGMQVRDQTGGIFGGTDVRDLGEPIPGAPTLVIKGLTLFGGVSVHGPKPSKRRAR